MNQNGFSILEAIIATTFVAMIAITIGQMLLSLDRIGSLALSKTEARAYAEELIEYAVDAQDDLFACHCAPYGPDNCSASTCTRASDGQSCALFDGYQSCWTPYPEHQASMTRFYFDTTGATPILVPLSPGAFETVSANPRFSRVVEIDNALRDANGDIAENGTADPNAKFITGTVHWVERGVTRTSVIRTLLTAWKNL